MPRAFRAHYVRATPVFAAYATAHAQRTAPHPDAAALVLLISIVLAMVVVCFLWLRAEEPPPAAEPAWWPEFERQFAAYVASDRSAESPPRRP
jgi:hypothetical protein